MDGQDRVGDSHWFGLHRQLDTSSSAFRRVLARFSRRPDVPKAACGYPRRPPEPVKWMAKALLATAIGIDFVDTVYDRS